jgi:hypothetical protein
MEANGLGTPQIQPQYRFTVKPVRLGWQGHEPLEFFLYLGDECKGNQPFCPAGTVHHDADL